MQGQTKRDAKKKTFGNKGNGGTRQRRLYDDRADDDKYRCKYSYKWLGHKQKSFMMQPHHISTYKLFNKKLLITAVLAIKIIVRESFKIRMISYDSAIIGIL